MEQANNDGPLEHFFLLGGQKNGEQKRESMMQIRVVRFTLCTSPVVQAFVDIEVDSWLRFNGVNYLRDGTLKSAQLTWRRDGQRMFLSAFEIHPDLCDLVAAEILAAIRAYVDSLPAEERMKPPAPPKPAQVKTATPAPKPAPANGLTPQPPPRRLLPRQPLTPPIKRSAPV